MQQMASAFNETMSDLDMQIREITEEKQAAERGRQQFKLMVDALPTGLVMADANLNAIYQNPASEERTRATTMLVKRLKKALDNTDSIQQAIGRLSDSIEHMVIEARLEVGRAGEAGSGMKIIVDEIRRLGREATRVNKDTHKRMENL